METRTNARLDTALGMFETRFDVKLSALEVRMDTRLDIKLGSSESRMNAKFEEKLDALEVGMDEKIDALALSTQQEFAAVNQEFGAVREEMAEGFAMVWKRLDEIEGKMVTKQDFFQFETRIMSAIGAIADEIKNLNSRVLILEKIVRP
jgi:hypothetical protein